MDEPRNDGTGLGAVLEQATLAAHHAAFEYADQSCAPELATARAESWRLIHLLGALSDLATAFARNPELAADAALPRSRRDHRS